MAMPQRDDTIEAIKRLDALLEYAVMHGDEEKAERIREGCASWRNRFDGRWRLKSAAVWYDFNMNARRITEIATHLEMRESTIDPLLGNKSRLKTIHSSLASEQNTLTLKQVTDIRCRMARSIGRICPICPI